MAFPAAESTPTVSTVEARRSWWARFAAALEAYPLERIGMAAIAAGVVLRLLAPFVMDIRADGNTYVAMGHAWMLHHQFLMPYGDVTTWYPTAASYSHHYPPAFPLYLGLFFSAFGFGLAQAKAASVVMSLVALGVVYLVTRDLYGNVPAALATGLLALEPHLVWVTGAGFSENMVLVFFALTMWAILKSLENDKYIVFAGLFAGLTYLTRASVGYFIFVAGAGGFLWRLYYLRWRLFTNYWYGLAILVFLTIFGLWAWRNVALFGSEPFPMPIPAFAIGLGLSLAVAAVGAVALAAGVRNRAHAATVVGGVIVALGALGAIVVLVAMRAAGADLFALSQPLLPNWETSTYTKWAQTLAFQKPGDWAYAAGVKFPFFVAFLAWYVIPFLPESWRATKKIREEKTSALWLSVFLVWLTAWVFCAMFWVQERANLYWFDNHRYVVIGLLPLAWLLFREADWSKAGTRLRVIVLALSLFAACGAVVLSPVKFPDTTAAVAMDPYVRPGDMIGVDGPMIKYSFYAYMQHPEQVNVFGYHWEPCTGAYVPPEGPSAQFVVSWCEGVTYDNHTMVGTFAQHTWGGYSFYVHLWARNDIIAERGIPADLSQTN